MLDVGCNLYLTKPIKKESLLQAIEVSLGLRSIGHGTPEQVETAPLNSGTPIDLETISYLAVVPRAFEPIIDKILSIKRTQVKDLHAAVETKDFDNLKKCAHKMKGSHGIKALHALASALEHTAVANDLNTCTKLVLKIDDLLTNVKISFEDEDN